MAEATLIEAAAVSTLAQRELQVLQDQLDAAQWELDVLRRTRDTLEQRLAEHGRQAARQLAELNAALATARAVECDCVTLTSGDGRRITRCSSAQMEAAAREGHAFRVAAPAIVHPTGTNS